MKAAVFYGKHDLRIEELPVPEPKEGYSLVKVAYCGICGTDVHIFEGDKGAGEIAPGSVIGHEFSGTLVESGEAVTIDPNYFCGECPSCLAGNPHYCKDMFKIGGAAIGGFSEYTLVHDSQIYRVPAHVHLDEACFAEPISCCLHGTDLTDIQASDRVLITGAGTIGLIILQICRDAGSSYIAVSEPIESKRVKALSLGADSVFDSDVITAEKLKKCNFNKVIECSGNIKAVETALACCANAGTVMLYGLTKPDDTVGLKPFDLFRRELTVKASFINPLTIQRAISMIADGKIKVRELVAEKISIENLPAYLAQSKEKLIKGKILVDLAIGK